MPIFEVAPATVETPSLPEPEVSQSFADGNLTVTLVFPMNYPDEAVEVSTRDVKEKDETAGSPTFGKKIATGETRVTSRTYGRADKISLGLVDAEGNLMRISAKILAPNPAEVAAAQAEVSSDVED